MRAGQAPVTAQRAAHRLTFDRIPAPYGDPADYAVRPRGHPWLPWSSAHRSLHERADSCLVGGGQLRQREVGRPHGVPSSRFAWSLKPSIAYLVLNFCALWKKQTILPS
jgi:hypothetical protein